MWMQPKTELSGRDRSDSDPTRMGEAEKTKKRNSRMRDSSSGKKWPNTRGGKDMSDRAAVNKRI